MPHVIDAEKMPHDEVGVVFAQLGEQVGHHAVVHRVQVLDVERRVVEGLGEEPRIETQPRVVAHESHVPAAGFRLVQEIILQDLMTVEVATDVDEGGQTACGEGLKSLHRCRRGVRDKLEYSRVLRVLSEKVTYERHLVSVRRRRRVEGRVVDDEVVSQGVYE